MSLGKTDLENMTLHFRWDCCWTGLPPTAINEAPVCTSQSGPSVMAPQPSTIGGYGIDASPAMNEQRS